MNESLFQKLKMVKGKDLLHVFLFLFALLPANVLKRIRPHLWLITESGREARDNGYWFFYYLRRKQPQVDAVYAIDPTAAEAEKVSALGETVPFGSFRHWIYYLAAEANVSSQKYGNPNAAVCYVLENVLGLLQSNRVFLQHGVIKDDLPFLHADKCSFRMFSCAALPEYEFVRDTFGYEDGVVRHVGLCRFDALHHNAEEKDLIAIIPTWRMQLERAGSVEDFKKSAYYQAWSALLKSKELERLLEQYQKRAVFCLHRNMEQFEDLLKSELPQVTVLPWQEADIASLIQNASMLITDYSSIFMDFAYQEKPILYYQFDREDFRENHLPQGYFNYDTDAFGPICKEEETLLQELNRCLQTDGTMAEPYLTRVHAFYTFHDADNSARTYEAIKEQLNLS